MLDEYRTANYRASIEQTVKNNLPGLFWTHFLLAAAYGQLGELDSARRALGDLLALKPDFAEHGMVHPLALVPAGADDGSPGWVDESRSGEDGGRHHRRCGSPVRRPRAMCRPRAESGFWVAARPPAPIPISPRGRRAVGRDRHGPVTVLVSASSRTARRSATRTRPWTLGALVKRSAPATYQGTPPAGSQLRSGRQGGRHHDGRSSRSATPLSFNPDAIFNCRTISFRGLCPPLPTGTVHPATDIERRPSKAGRQAQPVPPGIAARLRVLRARHAGSISVVRPVWSGPSSRGRAMRRPGRCCP